MTLLEQRSVGTRAVVRPIEAGAEDICPADHGGCGGVVKFSAQTPLRFRKKVIANVYWQGKWNRLEIWHLLCYVAQGMPYGRPPDLKPELLEDIREVLARGIDPTSMEAVQALQRLSALRKEGDYHPERPAKI